MMLKGIWENTEPVIKMIIFLGLILVCSAIFSMAGIALCTVVFGSSLMSISSAMSDMGNPQSVAMLKFLQIISQLGMMIIPALLAAWFFSKQPAQYVHAEKTGNGINYLLVMVMMLAASPFINYLVELNSHLQLPTFLAELETQMRNMEEEAARITEVFLNMKTGKDLWINLLMIGVLPAIGEELLFRGVLQRLLREITGNVHVSILITSVLFSAIHMQFFGFVPRMLLGLLFGYLLYWSGSIWLPIMAHFVNNASAVIFSYLAKRVDLPFNPDEIGIASGQGWMVAVSAVLIGGTAVFLWRKFQSHSYSS
jgi:uncharacterized protein